MISCRPPPAPGAQAHHHAGPPRPCRNICRSPTAEAMFTSVVERAGVVSAPPPQGVWPGRLVAGRQRALAALPPERCGCTCGCTTLGVAEGAASCSDCCRPTGSSSTPAVPGVAPRTGTSRGAGGAVLGVSRFHVRTPPCSPPLHQPSLPPLNPQQPAHSQMARQAAALCQAHRS